MRVVEYTSLTGDTSCVWMQPRGEGEEKRRKMNKKRRKEGE